MVKYDFTVPEKKRVRYIVHTDAKNEADDQFTIAHALMTPCLDVKALIAAHFDKTGRFGGKSAKASHDEILKVLDLMHLGGQYKALAGAEHALPDEKTPVESDGARFIIDEAMRDDPRPLYIGVQGAITDLASAILMEPRICNRMTCIWIGGGAYPEGGSEFNLMQDINGANVVFKSSMPLWQVPKDVYKQFSVSLAELQLKVKPHGKIGRYLFTQMVELNDALGERLEWPHGEVWGLGDEGVISALMEEEGRTSLYTVIDAPVFDIETMKYVYGKLPGRKIRVYHTMDARKDLEDLFAKLALNFPERDS